MTQPAGFAGFPTGTILLDKYRVVRELGMGGMSLVVCAEHIALRTKVAMKFLLPQFANLPDAVPRFLREAQATGRIQSEHVARVLDEGTLPDGTPYIVMEYLEGEDLGRFMKRGERFNVQEALELIVQAAYGLSQAHAAGVVHRDVKPANLFVTRRSDGSPVLKVLDFGISKVVEEAAKGKLDLTKTTEVMGSALYMSLEQMRSPKTVDHRTDIYALGVTLYELLSGSHPFFAESFSELCVKVSLDPPVPLRKHRPDVPPALAEAIALAYARLPEARYQTAGQFAMALSPFAKADTKARAEEIRRLERATHPDAVEPLRKALPPPVQPSPSPRWSLYGVLIAAGVTGAALLWVGWNPGTTGGSFPATTATAPSTVTSSLLCITVAATEAATAATTVPTLALPPATDAGPPKIDAAGSAPAPTSADPCAGKPQGTRMVMPNGRVKPCGL